MTEALTPATAKAFSTLARTILACRSTASQAYVPKIKVLDSALKTSREDSVALAYRKPLVVKKNSQIKRSLTEEFVRQYSSLLEKMVPVPALIMPDVFYECEPEDVFFDCEPIIEKKSFCDRGSQTVPMVAENTTQTEFEVATVATNEVVDTASQTVQEPFREAVPQVYARDHHRVWCSPVTTCLAITQAIMVWTAYMVWFCNQPMNDRDPNSMCYSGPIVA
jgi:hypothetical protein